MKKKKEKESNMRKMSENYEYFLLNLLKKG
jgi:hypothetical protein